MSRKKKSSPFPVDDVITREDEWKRVRAEFESEHLDRLLYEGRRIESITLKGDVGVLKKDALESIPGITEPADFNGFHELRPEVKEKTMTTKNGYYIGQDARLIFNTAYRMSQAAPDTAIKIMMLGASGNGKTTLPRIFSQAVGMDFYRMNCAKVRDPEEWFGYREARDGSTVFIRSHFITLLEKGNLVVVLDEFNRVEPWLHNTLFPLLDDDGYTVVHDQEFRIGPNVIVVATINTGYRYTGVFELDEALYNRFHLVLELNSLPPAEEIEVLCQRTGLTVPDARPVVKMANILREKDVVCSTRTTLTIASLMAAGMTIREAFEYTVVRRLPQEMGGNNYRKNIVDQLNSEIGVYQKREIESDVFGEMKGDSQSPEGTVVVFLKRDLSSGDHFPNVQVIKALRALDYPSGPLSLREANNWAIEISGGETVAMVIRDTVDVVALSKTLLPFGVTVEIKA